MYRDMIEEIVLQFEIDQLLDAQRKLLHAESALMDIDGTLEAFDVEAIYKTDWFRSENSRWKKCDTRRTKHCYFIVQAGDRGRRFRRDDVEADKLYEGYHLGRCIHQQLVDERQRRAETLDRCRQEVFLIQNRIDRLPPRIRSGTKSNWMREGF